MGSGSYKVGVYECHSKRLSTVRLEKTNETDDLLCTAIRGEPCQTWSWTDEVAGVENERYDSLLVQDYCKPRKLREEWSSARLSVESVVGKEGKGR
jgi:hypothetical protein